MQDDDYEDFDDAEDDQNCDDIFVIDKRYFFGKSGHRFYIDRNGPLP